MAIGKISKKYGKTWTPNYSFSAHAFFLIPLSQQPHRLVCIQAGPLPVTWVHLDNAVLRWEGHKIMGARVHPKSNCLSAPMIEDYPQEKHVVWDAVKSSCSP